MTLTIFRVLIGSKDKPKELIPGEIGCKFFVSVGVCVGFKNYSLVPSTFMQRITEKRIEFSLFCTTT